MPYIITEQFEAEMTIKRQILRRLIEKKDSSTSLEEYEVYLMLIWDVQAEMRSMKHAQAAAR